MHLSSSCQHAPLYPSDKADDDSVLSGYLSLEVGTNDMVQRKAVCWGTPNGDSGSESFLLRETISFNITNYVR